MGEISPPTAADYAWDTANTAQRTAKSNSGDIRYLREWAIKVSLYLEMIAEVDYDSEKQRLLKQIMMAAAPIAAGNI